MKKIINGKRFDTEKSICIGSYEYANSGDFNRVCEGLYITPISKQYFLAGEGGANTKYRTVVSQNSWTGGDLIQPMDKEDAFEWAQEYLQPHEVEKHFTDMIEDA